MHKFQSLGSEETIKLMPKIVPIIPANNAGVVVFSKVLSDPVIFLTLWSIISLLDEPFSVNVGAMDF